MITSQEVLTVREAAAELRCSPSHLYKVLLGAVPGVSALPTISLGRRRLIRRATFEDWKRANEQAHTDAMIRTSPKI